MYIYAGGDSGCCCCFGDIYGHCLRSCHTIIIFRLCWRVNACDCATAMKIAKGHWNNCQKWYCVLNVSRFLLVWKIYRLKNLQLIIVSSSINLHFFSRLVLLCPLNNFCVRFVMPYFFSLFLFLDLFLLLLCLQFFTSFQPFKCVNLSLTLTPILALPLSVFSWFVIPNV